MTQHLVMFVVDDGGDSEISKSSLEKDIKQYVYDQWGNGSGIASYPVVVELTAPEYSESEQDYIGDQIAEMQEEIADRKSEQED